MTSLQKAPGVFEMLNDLTGENGIITLRMLDQVNHVTGDDASVVHRLAGWLAVKTVDLATQIRVRPVGEPDIEDFAGSELRHLA
jgi:hypothetical protein